MLKPLENLFRKHAKPDHERLVRDLNTTIDELNKRLTEIEERLKALE